MEGVSQSFSTMIKEDTYISNGKPDKKILKLLKDNKVRKNG